MLAANQILNNRYQIIGPLGKQGGMSTVYRAHDLNLQHDCIVKELRVPPESDAKQTQGAIEQFHHEATTLANLHHPSLPRVTDYFPIGDIYYLVMDFIAGTSLEEMIAGGIPERQLIDIANKLLEVLAYIHARNVVHRDIKPANIIIQSNGNPVLVDFGLTKPGNLTTKTFVHGWGTIEYAPLEQISGGTDVRTDIYSLGATLYHALTGFLPTSSIDRMAGKPLFPPSQMKPGVSQPFERVIMKSMELNRLQRFQTADEFRAVLQGGRPTTRKTTYGTPGTGQGTAVSTPEAPKAQAKLWPIIGLLVILLAAAGAVIVLRPGSLPTSIPTAAPVVRTLEPSDVTSPSVQEDTRGDKTIQIATTVPAPATTAATLRVATTEVPQPATTEAPVIVTTVPPPQQPAIARQYSLGQSAGGRDIAAYEMGYPNGQIVIVVGGIQGDQNRTTAAARDVLNQYYSQPDQVPNKALLLIVPDINPDGSSGATRCNTNSVDLNRNWETSNWKQNAPPGCKGSQSASGGGSPFSEPESRALRDLILQQQNSGRRVMVIVLHTTVQSSKQPQIFAGYTASGLDSQSVNMLNQANSVLGYQYTTSWDYETTGEAISWCADHGVPSIDILWPAAGNGPSASQMGGVIDAITK